MKTLAYLMLSKVGCREMIRNAQCTKNKFYICVVNYC